MKVLLYIVLGVSLAVAAIAGSGAYVSPTDRVEAAFALSGPVSYEREVVRGPVSELVRDEVTHERGELLGSALLAELALHGVGEVSVYAERGALDGETRVLAIDEIAAGQTLGMDAHAVVEVKPEQRESLDLGSETVVLRLIAEEGDVISNELRDRLIEEGVDRVRVTDFRWSQWPERWWFTLGCAVMLGCGVDLRLRSRARPKAAESEGAGGYAEARGALSALRDEIRGLNEEAESLGDDEAMGRVIVVIDGVRRGALAVVHRTLAGFKSHERGYAKYAEIVLPMSAGERALHRAWSAAVDEDVAEARESLGRAVAMLEEAVALTEG